MMISEGEISLSNDEIDEADEEEDMDHRDDEWSQSEIQPYQLHHQHAN